MIKSKTQNTEPATVQNNSPRKDKETPTSMSDDPDSEHMDVSSANKTLTVTCEGEHPRPIDNSTPVRSIDVKLRDIADGKQ